jgi:hypothetical protein
MIGVSRGYNSDDPAIILHYNTFTSFANQHGRMILEFHQRLSILATVSVVIITIVTSNSSTIIQNMLSDFMT